MLRGSRLITHFLFNLWNSLTFLELNTQAANLEGCQGVLILEAAERNCVIMTKKEVSMKLVRGILKNTALW